MLKLITNKIYNPSNMPKNINKNEESRTINIFSRSNSTKSTPIHSDTENKYNMKIKR
jgi:hypothetical protein